MVKNYSDYQNKKRVKKRRKSTKIMIFLLFPNSSYRYFSNYLGWFYAMKWCIQLFNPLRMITSVNILPKNDYKFHSKSIWTVVMLLHDISNRKGSLSMFIYQSNEISTNLFNVRESWCVLSSTFLFESVQFSEHIPFLVIVNDLQHSRRDKRV